MKTLTWLVIGLALLEATVPPVLGAQGKPLSVTGVRGITFGVVFPGVPRVVVRTDAANAGQFDVGYAKFAPIQITFSLPAAMNGPAGATMPIVFGANDGGYSSPETITSQVGFDPRVAFSTALDKNGRAAVFIGGTAQPVSSQRAGNYTATITMTVTVLP
ncbi:MAG TPA: hypothetical protein VGQ18_15485 [Gemmatimonadales bacterium]|jgi:hypothetical protein|nr:hypothetical protein [Gemmatimonadales bacterium]